MLGTDGQVTLSSVYERVRLSERSALSGRKTRKAQYKYSTDHLPIIIPRYLISNLEDT